MKLKPYMVFSHSAGKQDGAVLVFAKTAKQARIVAWKDSYLTELADNYLDVRAKFLKNDWFETQCHPLKMADGIPHVILTPYSCKRCELWGEEILPGGLCGSCREIEEFMEDEE